MKKTEDCSHRTQSNPIHGWIQSMSNSGTGCSRAIIPYYSHRCLRLVWNSAEIACEVIWA